MLNVACGARYHEKWVNIDFNKTAKSVDKVNILKGLPFEEGVFDCIYTGHFLEHLDTKKADYLLSEAERVLIPGGTLRVVVPDLENVCREYLSILERIEEPENQKKYEWIIIELLDQLVRVNSGGKMAPYIKQVYDSGDLLMKDYIKKRIGYQYGKTKAVNNLNIFSPSTVRIKLLSSYLKALKKLFPEPYRTSMLVNTGVGERHLWMYDRFSLKQKLLTSGFEQVTFMEFNESRITDFNSYFLDSNEDGSAYKGRSSLYCEAVKPG